MSSAVLRLDSGSALSGWSLKVPVSQPCRVIQYEGDHQTRADAGGGTDDEDGRKRHVGAKKPEATPERDNSRRQCDGGAKLVMECPQAG